MAQAYLFLPRRLLSLPEENEYPLYCLQDDQTQVVVCTDNTSQTITDGETKIGRGKFVVTVSTPTSSYLPPRREKSSDAGWIVVFDSLRYKIKASGPWRNVATVLYDETNRRTSLSPLTLNTWLDGDSTSSSSSSTENDAGRMRAAVKFINRFAAISKSPDVSSGRLKNSFLNEPIGLLSWIGRFVNLDVDVSGGSGANSSARQNASECDDKEKSWRRMLCISLTLAQLHARFDALKQLVRLNNAVGDKDGGSDRAYRQMRRLLCQMGFDLLFGALVVALIICFPPLKTLNLWFREYVVLQESKLKTLVAWLNDVPLNFKVNHPLAEFMSKFVHLVLQHWFSFVRFVWPSSTPVWLKKNLANKIFGYLARYDFWSKLGLRF